MPEVSLFEVDLKGFEPHTFRNGASYARVKKELREAIVREVGQSKIDEGRKKINGNLVRLQVLFRLWEGSIKVSRTRSEKDLDNLLKPVLDVLQTTTDAQNNERGLNLIENDKLVHEINVKKEIVTEENNEGVHIAIYGMYLTLQ
jgi:Holliday junction resolvase RusA-like endonuclease